MTTDAAPAIRVHEIRIAEEIEALIPILLLAEPSAPALRWSLDHLSDAVYRAEIDATTAAAATMRWSGDACEIVELGVVQAFQRRGVGRAVVMWLAAEAVRRGKEAIEVGTGNASIGNLAFYQRCGFRFDRIRHDYFRYHKPPLVEDGITVRDLVVFRRELRGAR